MPPPPATSVPSRLFLGPALRTQSDRRLVSLVRDGYENAFEEIVRRYGKPLGRYAAAIVSSNRAEDVTQDAFSKALLALRDTDKEIELRPWLYRIVRNTALNDLRDQPPAAVPLREDIDGVETPLDATERREEINELVQRLQALPDPQRAAIVMRELEGLSHEEIAAALGMTGGAARQTIHRARRKLRNGAGMLIPLPLLHFLLASTVGGTAAGAGLGGAAAGAGVASAGGAGAGIGIKAGVASLVVAGSVATGVALNDSSGERFSRSAQPLARQGGGTSGVPPALGFAGAIDDSSGEEGSNGGRGSSRDGDRRGRGGREGENEGPDGGARGDSGPGPSSGPGGGGSSSGPGGDGPDDDEDSEPSRSGSGHGSGSSGSGSGGDSGSGSSGSGGSGGSSGSSDSGSSGSGSGGGDSSGSGSGGEPEPDHD